MSAIRRIDTAELKRSRPIVDVVASYGIDLRPRGRTAVGRCPFHADGGRPNLYVYPATDSFFCFRCGVGGDAITFVERIEGIAFRDAVDRLTGAGLSAVARPLPSLPLRRRRTRSAPWGPDEWACLAAAVELYHNRLLTEMRALAYVERRGLERETLTRYRVGYAAGNCTPAGPGSQVAAGVVVLLTCRHDGPRGSGSAKSRGTGGPAAAAG